MEFPFEQSEGEHVGHRLRRRQDERAVDQLDARGCAGGVLVEQGGGPAA
ncbi:hypothetical protein AB0J42_09720 [Nonomuraea sp. NPDC049649]